MEEKITKKKNNVEIIIAFHNLETDWMRRVGGNRAI